ncbi:MAG: dienelactone hydrolase family protein [Bacteroidales bacterium]|nr:dienelactone hydrolase family protein [Bacteroidales bacterium]
MIRKLILKFALIFISIATFGQFEKHQSFEHLDSISRVYLRANKLDSAILAVEFALDKYPAHDEKATFILGFLYVRAGYDSKALSNWDYGQKKGYFYGLDNRLYKNHFGENEGFKKIAKIDKRFGEKLDSSSHIEYEIVRPKDYSENRKYPLIFVFHGNGRNLQKAKQTWTSDVMANKCIVVYLQACIHTSPYDYRWNLRDDKTTLELIEIYEEMVKINSVDTNKIILAGMSAGGMVAIDYGFNRTLAYTDYLLNCPVVPDIAIDLIDNFVSTNKQIVIITGENDFALNGQKELIEKIKEKKGRAEIKIIEGLGHQFTEDFSFLLDEYLIKLIE